jgi:hypothetical protein
MLDTKREFGLGQFKEKCAKLLVPGLTAAHLRKASRGGLVVKFNPQHHLM